MVNRKKLISIVIPVMNEELNIDSSFEAVAETFTGLSDSYDFEIIFTDNRSSDSTFLKIQALAAIHENVRAVRFSRNVGYQRSILTGYLLAAGDAIVQLDCDLQDPPSLIPEFIEKWEEGHEVVYGIRRSRKEGFIINSVRKIFYHMVNFLSEDNLPQNVGDFRLVDRKIVNSLRTLRSKSPYIRGQIAALGFEQLGIEYDRDERKFGETKFNFGSLLKLSVDAIVGHSVAPLRFASYIGFAATLFAFILACAYLVLALSNTPLPAGFTTLAVLMLLNIGFVSLFLGVIGEYLIRVVEQVTIGPISIVDQSVNLPEQRLAECKQVFNANV